MAGDRPKYAVAPDPEFGFARVTPTPSADEITRFYADEFYSGEYKRFNNSSLESQERDRAFNDGHREDVLAAMEEAGGGAGCLEGRSLLDAGCGYAQALAFFRGKGLDVAGFDPAPEAVAHAKSLGLDVVHAGMEKMRVFDRRFDVVTLFHVLEHLADPAAVLREIRQEVLTPGGMLVLEVPNEFNDFQVAGKEVHSLDEWWIAPPAHLNYFSRPTLTRLLEGTGFRPAVFESTFPMEMFLLFGDNYVKDSAAGSEAHRRRVAFEQNLRRLKRESTLRRFYRALATENLGRTLVVVARVA